MVLLSHSHCCLVLLSVWFILLCVQPVLPNPSSAESLSVYQQYTSVSWFFSSHSIGSCNHYLLACHNNVILNGIG